MSEMETPTIVVNLTAADARLIDLGFHQLIDELLTAPDDPTLVAARTKLAAHKRLLQARADIRRAESVLVEERPDPFSLSSSLNGRIQPNDSAEVRLSAPILAMAERGLGRFLERNEPTTVGEKVVDPPEKVRMTLFKVKLAHQALAQKATLPALEADALA